MTLPATVTDLAVSKAIRKLRRTSTVQFIVGRQVWSLCCFLPSDGRTGAEPVVLDPRSRWGDSSADGDRMPVCSYEQLIRARVRDAVTHYWVWAVMKS